MPQVHEDMSFIPNTHEKAGNGGSTCNLSCGERGETSGSSLLVGQAIQTVSFRVNEGTLSEEQIRWMTKDTQSQLLAFTHARRQVNMRIYNT